MVSFHRWGSHHWEELKFIFIKGVLPDLITMGLYLRRASPFLDGW